MYHSSLKEPARAPAVQRADVHGSVALVADLACGLPPEFASCDLLYTEAAWEYGYERFVQRAGGGSDYPAYFEALRALATDGKQPLVLVCGKRALKGLPDPKDSELVNINSGGTFVAEAVAVAFRCKLPKVTKRHEGWLNLDTENLLRALARKYHRVGDPSCGYGNTGRIFAEHGRTFVMSDLNPTCIGYIAEHAGEWVAARA